MAGRKIYYKVIVRICEFIKETKGVDFRISNEGYVIIQNNQFEGVLTLDYISGKYNSEEQSLTVEISDFDNELEIFIFSNENEEFELPGEFLLGSNLPGDNKLCHLTFEEIVKDPKKKEEINQSLKEIKKIHEITN